MSVRKATLDDLTYIVSLAQQASDCIGFIPRQAYEMEIVGKRKGSIIVAEANQELVGYLYATHNAAGVTHIQQIVVQPDAQRMQYASALVAAVQKDNDWLITCRCAADLQATDFWHALGFEPMCHAAPKRGYHRRHNDLTIPTRRKRIIIQYQRVVGGLWLPRLAAREPKAEAPRSQ